MKSLRTAALVAAIGVCVLAGGVSAQTKAERRAAREDAQKAAQAADEAKQRAGFDAALPARMELVNAVLNQYAAEFAKDGMDGVTRMSHFAMTVHKTPSEVLKSARSGKSVSEFVGLQVKGLLRFDGQKTALGDTTNLVFFGVGPCRFADSRFSSGGALTNSIRTYLNFAAAGQGGTAPCNQSIPGLTSGSPGAIAMNIAIAVPSADGNLIARPVGSTNVTAAVNFTAGQIISNATVIPMTGNGGPDFELLPGINSPTGTTHVILDLLGFYVPSQPVALQCVDTATVTGTTGTNPAVETTISAPACAATHTRVGISCTENDDAVLVDFSVASGSCAYIPRAAIATGINISARCCRVPGSNDTNH